MATPFGYRGWIVLGAGLCGGVALGTLLPSEAGAGAKAADQAKATLEKAKSEAGSDGPGSGGTAAKSTLPTAGADSLNALPPEKVMALFEKVSNLKSDSRKYILAYRLASQMQLGQIEEALNAAMKDLSDGDYVTTRALARRWVELDPKGAAAKALETKQQHLVVPVLEAWTRADPAGPLSWALQQDPATRAEAVRPLLMGRLLDQPQLEKLVMNAGSSDNEEMRKQVFPFATARLSESNPNGALHAASGMDDPELRQRTLSMVLSRVGQNAPDVGRAWIASQTGLTAEEKQQYEQALANPRGGWGRGSRGGPPPPQPPPAP